MVDRNSKVQMPNYNRQIINKSRPSSPEGEGMRVRLKNLNKGNATY
jgi:hypothetical protein